MVLSRTPMQRVHWGFEATSDSAAEPQVRCGDLRVPFGHPAVRERADVGLRRSASVTGVFWRMSLFPTDSGCSAPMVETALRAPRRSFFFKVGPFSERQSRHSSELTGAKATGG
jgi:hypothetical protein